MSPCLLCMWCVGGCVLDGGLAGGGVWFLRVGSVSGARVCGGVRVRVGGGVWFPRGN